MKDNGLLQYYKKGLHTDNGMLDLAKIPFENRKWKNGEFSKITGQGSFYIKRCGYSAVDAEVLVSQIAAQLGLSTAIYLPAYCFVPHVISNDISSANTMKMWEYTDLLYEQLADSPQSWNEIGDITDYFTKQAQRKLAIQEALNIASENVDGHAGNRFVKVNKNESFTKGHIQIETEIVEDVGGYDFGKSFCRVDDLGKPIPRTFHTMFSEEGICEYFSILSKPRAIQRLKENPVVQEVLPSSEMAEMIGNTDIFGIAADVTETTGYEFSRCYLKDMANSFYNVANEFAK